LAEYSWLYVILTNTYREYNLFITFTVKQLNSSHYSDQPDMFPTIHVLSQVPHTSYKLLQNVAFTYKNL